MLSLVLASVAFVLVACGSRDFPTPSAQDRPSQSADDISFTAIADRAATSIAEQAVATAVAGDQPSLFIAINGLGDDFDAGPIEISNSVTRLLVMHNGDGWFGVQCDPTGEEVWLEIANVVGRYAGEIQLVANDAFAPLGEYRCVVTADGAWSITSLPDTGFDPNIPVAVITQVDFTELIKPQE